MLFVIFLVIASLKSVRFNLPRAFISPFLSLLAGNRRGWVEIRRLFVQFEITYGTKQYISNLKLEYIANLKKKISISRPFQGQTEFLGVELLMTILSWSPKRVLPLGVLFKPIK